MADARHCRKDARFPVWRPLQLGKAENVVRVLPGWTNFHLEKPDIEGPTLGNSAARHTLLIIPLLEAYIHGVHFLDFGNGDRSVGYGSGFRQRSAIEYAMRIGPVFVFNIHSLQL